MAILGKQNGDDPHLRFLPPSPLPPSPCGHPNASVCTFGDGVFSACHTTHATTTTAATATTTHDHSHNTHNQPNNAHTQTHQTHSNTHSINTEEKREERSSEMSRHALPHTRRNTTLTQHNIHGDGHRETEME